MAKAIELVVGKEFFSKHDTDDKKTTWILRTLSGIEFMRCTQSGFVDTEMVINLGLTGWKDFPDKGGNEIEFSVKNFKYIPAFIAQDIYSELEKISLLSGEERKNS